jgi:hypothetical protein
LFFFFFSFFLLLFLFLFLLLCVHCRVELRNVAAEHSAPTMNTERLVVNRAPLAGMGSSSKEDEHVEHDRERTDTMEAAPGGRKGGRMTTDISEMEALTNLIWQARAEPGECFHVMYHLGRQYCMERAVKDDIRGRTVPWTHSRAFGPGPVDWLVRRAWYAWEGILTCALDHGCFWWELSDLEDEDTETDFMNDLADETPAGTGFVVSASMQLNSLEDEMDARRLKHMENWREYWSQMENSEDESVEDDVETDTDSVGSDGWELTYKQVSNQEDVVIYRAGHPKGYVHLGWSPLSLD